jgi:PAS domain S-box-containing protein
VKDREGNIIGASKIVRDITGQKRLELELKESVEFFTAMADNVPAMIWMSGTDRYSDFFNRTWLQFTGRTREQESNEKWLENVHPDDVQKCVKGYNEAFNEQKGRYVEYRLRRHDGQYRWIADNSVPRYNRDGSFAGFISACFDIDDQKNDREKIMESELRLKTISSAAPVGLWMTDTKAQNIFVNDTWIEWTGIPFKEQLGTGWLGTVVEEDKVNAPAKFWDSMLKREKYSTEFRIRRPDGEMRWCLTEGSPYYNMDGEFAGYAGSVTDITDIRKMEERKDDFIKMAES